MDALEAIFTRRSTRKMKSEMPPRDMIEKIIEAGRYAPSGSNSQSTHLIVITQKEILDELAAFAMESENEHQKTELTNSIEYVKHNMRENLRR